MSVAAPGRRACGRVAGRVGHPRPSTHPRRRRAAGGRARRPAVTTGVAGAGAGGAPATDPPRVDCVTATPGVPRLAPPVGQPPGGRADGPSCVFSAAPPFCRAADAAASPIARLAAASLARLASRARKGVPATGSSVAVGQPITLRVAGGGRAGGHACQTPLCWLLCTPSRRGRPRGAARTGLRCGELATGAPAPRRATGGAHDPATGRRHPWAHPWGWPRPRRPPRLCGRRRAWRGSHGWETSRQRRGACPPVAQAAVPLIRRCGDDGERRAGGGRGVDRAVAGCG